MGNQDSEEEQLLNRIRADNGLHSSLSERDHLAIRKTFSGFSKLLYPDGRMTDEEAREIIDFATEGRKRVKDQLYAIDETFNAEPAKFVYTWLPTGESVKVETLEGLEFDSQNATSQNQDNAHPSSEQEQKAGMEGTTSETSSAAVKGKRPRIPALTSKVITIRENQGGITYKGLFVRAGHHQDSPKYTERGR